MPRIPLIKLAAIASISAATFLSGCATLERDSLFENPNPPPVEATRKAQAFGAPSAAMRPVAGYRHP